MKVRLLVAFAAASAAAFVAAGSAGAATNHSCTNDILAPGTYLNVSVSGFCNLASSGLIHIQGNLHVNGGAVFNASSCAVLAVDGGAQVDAGAVFDLDGRCETKGINRGVAFDNALSFFIVDSAFVHGGIISNGGGGSGANPCGRHDVPLTGNPRASVAGNFVGGNVTFNGFHGCLAEVIGNEIVGGVSLVNNITQVNVLGGNSIGGNLFCKFNQPAPITSGTGLNTVLGTVNPSACVPLVA